jgi:uncharacterized protein YybS (DUF2232 family)
MGGSPAARRVLLGAGLGLGLALLDAATPRGWWGGLATVASLVPVAVALALGGPPAAAVAAALAMAGIGAARGGSAALVLGLKCVLPGVALGLALQRRWSVATAALVTGLASLAGLVLLLWALTPGGATPLAYLERQLAAHAAEFEAWPAQVGAGGEAAWTAEAARVVVAVLRLAGPGMIGLGVLAGALANYAVARLCLRRLGGFRAFAEEAVPDHLVWAVIGAGLFLVTREARLTTLGLSALLVLAPLYAIQGLAVFRHFFLRLGIPRVLQVIGFGLCAIQPVLLLAVSCVGLSDLWIDFRKIRQAPTAVSG